MCSPRGQSTITNTIAHTASLPSTRYSVAASTGALYRKSHNQYPAPLHQPPHLQVPDCHQFSLLLYFACFASMKAPSLVHPNGTTRSSRVCFLLVPLLLLPMGCVRKVTVAPIKPFNSTVALPERQLPQLPILAYHRVHPTISNHMVVSPALFRAHLEALRAHGYSFISLDSWFAALRGETHLPPKPIAVSFDDGWRDQYQYALPILTEFNAPAIFYIYPATVGSEDAMSWHQLSELSQRGHLIGCHSATHSDLARPFAIESRQQYLARLRRETREARTTLSQRLGQNIVHFCYPYGYYNSNVLAFVREAGFLSATTVNPVVNDAATFPLLLGRFIVAPWMSPQALIHLVSARRLEIEAVPPDAAMPETPTTCLRAYIPNDALSLVAVRMKWNWRWADAHWDPSTRTVSLPFAQPLAPGIYTAQIHAWDALSNHYVAAWLFHQTRTVSSSSLSSPHRLAQLQRR